MIPYLTDVSGLILAVLQSLQILHQSMQVVQIIDLGRGPQISATTNTYCPWGTAI